MFVYTLNELLSYIVHLIMLKRHNMNTIKKRVCQNDASSLSLYNHWFIIFHKE